MRARVMLTLLLVSCAAQAQESAPSRPTTSAASRYQLFQGEYYFINLRGEGRWSKALFRIDTATGQVWIGEQIQSVDATGRAVQKRFWQPFEQELEIPPEAVDAMRKK